MEHYFYFYLLISNTEEELKKYKTYFWPSRANHKYTSNILYLIEKLVGGPNHSSTKPSLDNIIIRIHNPKNTYSISVQRNSNDEVMDKSLLSARHYWLSYSDTHSLQKYSCRVTLVLKIFRNLWLDFSLRDVFSDFLFLSDHDQVTTVVLVIYCVSPGRVVWESSRSNHSKALTWTFQLRLDSLTSTPQSIYQST